MPIGSAPALHAEGAYGHLLAKDDAEKVAWLRRFQPFDLYSKGDVPPEPGLLQSVYEPLVAAHLPDSLYW